jgi:hypothetical protein
MTDEETLAKFGEIVLKFYEESLNLSDEDKKYKLTKQFKEYQSLPNEYKNSSMLLIEVSFGRKIIDLGDKISQLIEAALIAYELEDANKNLN